MGQDPSTKQLGQGIYFVYAVINKYGQTSIYGLLRG